MDPQENCTHEDSKEIKAIGKDSIHRICSGQVVLSLAIAVKELVENSIDAGATLVEVKLKKQGLESIEVVDNGSGVEKENLEGLTAKYHTSKLRQFEDLRSVNTFGFRGEALSSLCALCNVVITTRHKLAEIGNKIEYDHSGKIKKQVSCARLVGTTVSLTNIFGTLPVRQRELTKNIKAEFNKMCQILRAYCLVAKGVRIICTNQNNKGVWQTFLCTRGGKDILANIEDLYGAKGIEHLMEIKQPVAEEDDTGTIPELEELAVSSNISMANIDANSLAKFQLEGWISSCEHGCGFKLKERQYFYINSRPCEPKQVMKAVNDVYHTYNLREYPFVFLNIILPKNEVDVNLTPDKRQLLINDEKLLILAVKLALKKTFKNVPSTFRPERSVHVLDSSQCTNDSTIVDDDVELTSSQEKFRAILYQWKATGDTCSNGGSIKIPKRKQTDEITVQKMKMAKIQQLLRFETIKVTEKQKNTDGESTSFQTDSDLNDLTNVEDEDERFTQDEYVKKEQESIYAMRKCQVSNDEDVSAQPEPVAKSLKHGKSEAKEEQKNLEIIQCDENNVEIDINIEIDTSQASASSTFPQRPPDVEILYDDEADTSNALLLESSTSISVSTEEIADLVARENNLGAKVRQALKMSKMKFKNEINPNKNKNAEEELDREITRDMFSKMKIIGQYNLGFIIAKLGDDVFIIDQHATDEMYNFEMLQRSTQLQMQKLAIPQALEFTTVNEMILMDNLEVFKANGFEFLIDENAPPTQKVKLLSKPFSKNWEFGKNDIDELIFMLHDAPPNTMCRPSRIRAMFASRACRKSVMIGTALNNSTMRQLTDHMGEVDKPWNCPHGRPTMRHLVNLGMLQDDTEND